MTSTPSLERVSCSLTSKKGNASLSIPEKPDTRLHNLILLTSRALSQTVYPHTHPTKKSQPGFHAVNTSFIPSGGVVGVKKIIIQTPRIGLICVGRAVICCCWTVWMCKKKKKNWCWFSAHAGWHRWLAEINKGARAPANISTFLCRICICKQEKIDVQCVPFCKYCSVVVLVLTSKKKCRQSYLLSFKHTQIHICT